ncbi:pyridoxal-phosphate dependent enzyme [Candidatus Gottesmanbacteria bacterium]|nr:pyridoxal-phosphate dependent enzyme [Candidatus Gottesmanbacteria bacterium]
MEINKAKELGFKSVVVASTGNMAASVAAYSAQAGLECYVFVPENTPRGKLAQSLSYGAKVIQIRGTYNDAANLAVKASEKYRYYLAGDYVFRLEGQKSAGFELAEQMWRENIDWVIVPIGMGTNLSAIFKGLWEYYQLGLIDCLPRMVGVQAEGAHSIFKTDNRKHNTPRGWQAERSEAMTPARWKKQEKFYVKPVAKPNTIASAPNTIASAIAVGDPLDAPKVINALTKTNGAIEAAGDDETLRAQQLLTRNEALYVEPSAATTVVALEHLLKKGKIKDTDTVVCVATGAGLKDPATTLKVLAEPPTIEADLKEIERVIKGQLFAIRAGGVKEREKVLFIKTPSKNALKNLVKKEFSLDLTAHDLREVYEEVKYFIETKGKHIAKADLQSILEDAIQEKHPKILELVDFEITTSQKRRPHAKVEVKLKGKKYQENSEGVGPVDAGISAIRKILTKQNGIDFNIDDFNVEIPTTGADATVEVTMVLKDKKGNQVVEKTTSPDIIVASMNAYVAGYNELAFQKGLK